MLTKSRDRCEVTFDCTRLAHLITEKASDLSVENNICWKKKWKLNSEINSAKRQQNFKNKTEKFNPLDITKAWDHFMGSMLCVLFLWQMDVQCFYFMSHHIQYGLLPFWRYVNQVMFTLYDKWMHPRAQNTICTKIIKNLVYFVLCINR